ncbi:MAG TPA: hypothetical protein VFD67_10765, partial [Gemmatimonadaceae bacterium]|nr:hypothetical protein [Gemmatimonadaceae bacterium]
ICSERAPTWFKPNLHLLGADLESLRNCSKKFDTTPRTKLTTIERVARSDLYWRSGKDGHILASPL